MQYLLVFNPVQLAFLLKIFRSQNGAIVCIPIDSYFLISLFPFDTCRSCVWCSCLYFIYETFLLQLNSLSLSEGCPIFLIQFALKVIDEYADWIYSKHEWSVLGLVQNATNPLYTLHWGISISEHRAWLLIDRYYCARS